LFRSAASGRHRIDPLHMRAKLIAYLRNRGLHRRSIELRTTQFLAVIDKTLGNLVRQRAEHQVHPETLDWLQVDADVFSIMT
jgi:hypothetical protein